MRLPPAAAKALALAGMLACLCLTSVSHAAIVLYTTERSGPTAYDLTYFVYADARDIGELAIYFDPTFSDLRLLAAPARWDTLVVQPDPGLPAAGFVDLLALDMPLAQGSALWGLALRVTWHGAGTPPGQAYEVLDPVTFAVLDAGRTEWVAALPIDEPAPWLMLGAGAAILGWRRAARRHPGNP